MPPSKNVRVSEVQQEKILNFMNKNVDFANNRLVGPLGVQTDKKLWQELVDSLNSEGAGAFKNVEKWQKVSRIFTKSFVVHCFFAM